MSSNIDLFTTPSKEHTRQNVTEMPYLVGKMLFCADILAFFSAGFTSAIATVFIQHIFLGNANSFTSLISNPIYQNIYLSLAVVSLFVLWAKGFHMKRVPWWSQVQSIGKLCFYAFFLHGFLTFALKIPEPRTLIITTWLFAFLFILLFRSITYKLATKVSGWYVPTTIISDNQTAEDLMYALTSDISTGHQVDAILLRDPYDAAELDIKSLPIRLQKIRILYTENDLESYIKRNPHQYYIISFDAFDQYTRDHMARALSDNEAIYAMVPSISGTSVYHINPKYFFGHDVMMLENRIPKHCSDDTSPSKIAKRALDIAVSGSLILVLLPVFIFVPLFLKLEGQGGSPFYGGNRIGKGGRLFQCWKFRSMEPNSDHLLRNYLEANPAAQADWEKYRKLPNDPRITTHTARFIRKASLDELPQLWNVFVGDMSLVGPRPILEDETHYFEGNSLKEYQSVPPGITGLWQVSGRNSTSFKRRVYWDSWYVRNWSLWGDIVILIKTPIVLITRKGAS